jgi:hypothetical protein
MKINLLRGVQQHEDIWGSGGTAPSIINIDTNWWGAMSFTPRPLYRRVNSIRYALKRKLTVSQSRSGQLTEDKKLLSLPDIETRFIKSPSPSPSHYTDWATPGPLSQDKDIL